MTDGVGYGKFEVMPNVKTPVAMIIFNRPDLTEIVFREVARARPSKLLVVADGPRADRPGEAEKCLETRKIIDRVDWDCEVLRCFSETNLGCKRRVSSGISWVFEQVEEAIIVEDDCIPDPSFFPYCDELLERYRDDSQIMMISGSCFLGDRASKRESYYFGHLPLIWGWATWRRAWRKYDIAMTGWPEFRQSSRFRELFPSLSARYYYRRDMDRAYAGTLDTWDLQWSNTIWRSDGLCINPNRHLVRNIGFGPEATHTRFYDPAFDPPITPMDFPLVHPPLGSRPGLGNDRIWFDRHYSPISKVKRRLVSFGRRFTESRK